MSQQWLYEHNADNSARFVLGTVGRNPLVCFGINPSTAKPKLLDPTVGRVESFAESHGYDSWIMLNVYPQIATDPAHLHTLPAAALKVENERAIASAISGRELTLLAAWGVLINKRRYLRPLLRDILAMPALKGQNWVSLGPVTAEGHPRHPSRLATGTSLQPFDIDNY